MLRRLSISIIPLLVAVASYGQQDMDFHLGAHLFQGQNILKVKRDFYDQYVWVLAQNNRVYRVNALTMAVDDYTPKFAGYTGVSFVDIAGRSQDTVYVATSTTEVIEYEKGVLRNIDQSSGIDGAVNSIGLDYRSVQLGYYPFSLCIATTKGFYFYNFRTESISTQTNNLGPNQVFESTYRNLAISDVGDSYYDLTLQFPVRNLTWFTDYGGAVQYKAPPFGDTVRTYYYITNGFPAWQADDDDVDRMTQVWGTENGLFQNQWDDSYFLSADTASYLRGIKVNKVTSIFGLLAFSSPGSQFPVKMERENLLVGTQNGFYFTNNDFGNNGAGWLHVFNTFTLEPDIGNQVVNDVCVDVTGIWPDLCEDGVWVAAADGLYFLKPDYGAYINPENYAAVSFNGLPSADSTLNVCQGDSALAVVNPGLYSGNSIQWYKDGQPFSGKTRDTLAIKASGNYYAVLYDPCSGLHVTSNHLTVNIISAPVFTFNYPDKMQQCNNNPDTLQVTFNPGYHYRWYSDGVFNGDTTALYIVTQSGKYKVEVSACTNSWVPSKEVEVDLINLPIPQVSTDKQQYCAEDTAKLTVNVPADPSYTINWYQDNNLIASSQNQTTIKITTGGNYTTQISSNIGACIQTSAVLPVAFTPAPVFTFNYPDQLQYCSGTPVTLTASGSGSYQYQWYRNDTLLTGNINTSLNVSQAGKYKIGASACPGSWVMSKEVQVNFVNVTTPSIATDKAAYCQGDVATLLVNAQVNPLYTINWYKDGNLLSQAANQTQINITDAGNYTVSLTNTTPNTDGSACSATSVIQSISFDPPPTISIQQTANTGFCQGQTVTLTAQHSAGTVLWSTGETGDEITVTASGSYTATVTTAAGCQASATQTVNFLPDPAFAVNDTTICTFKKQVVTLNAPSGYAAYNWDNGASDQPTYQVSQPGKISLMVTDNNGCQATREISVTEQCPDVYIPNTFTPNGDGVNDTWDIQGLDATATVKVFTRWGSEVYETVGYNKPWDGRYQGRKLQRGVYYYIVTSKNNKQKFSGPLTIIY